MLCSETKMKWVLNSICASEHSIHAIFLQFLFINLNVLSIIISIYLHFRTKFKYLQTKLIFPWFVLGKTRPHILHVLLVQSFQNFDDMNRLTVGAFVFTIAMLYSTVCSNLCVHALRNCRHIEVICTPSFFAASGNVDAFDQPLISGFCNASLYE